MTNNQKTNDLVVRVSTCFELKFFPESIRVNFKQTEAGIVCFLVIGAW
jgi:hypothetical protein